MKRLLMTAILLGMVFRVALASADTLRIVPFSTSVSEEVFEKLASGVTSVTLTGIPAYPRGVTGLEKIYGKVKKDFIDLDYPRVVSAVQNAISLVSSNLKEMSEKNWNTTFRIMKIGALSAFAMRSYPQLDKILWNMVKWFPDRELKGRSISPDLYLRWRQVGEKVIRYRVDFDSPVSDVVIRVDGRMVKGMSDKVPVGVHQIVWHTPYEGNYFIKHIYSNSVVKIDTFPIPVSRIRKMVMEDGWCSKKLMSLFEDAGVDYPVLFVSATSPHYILVDPIVKGVILKGDYDVIDKINEVMESYSDSTYVPPLYCDWRTTPIYKKWWFYMGIGALVGGAAGVWYENMDGSAVVSW